MANIQYPYLPKGRIFEYVPADNPYMAFVKEYAKITSLDKTMPGAAIVVRDDVVLGIGTNGSDYHEKYGCERVCLRCKTGEGYELCEGCHPRNHSESQAIKATIANGNQNQGADLYLWGHWWCCKWCWDTMIEAGIKRVYLMEKSEILFNKEHPDNIVGRQFTVVNDTAD